MTNSRLSHSLMLSSHLFLCLPCHLPSFTVHCKMVLTKPDERETCPYHCSLRLFTMVRSLCGPIACWILTRTSSLVTWSLYEMRSILLWHLISMACILLWSSAVSAHDSQAYRKMHVTRERTRRILEQRNTPVVLNWFQSCQCCYCLCYTGQYLWLGPLISYN